MRTLLALVVLTVAIGLGAVLLRVVSQPPAPPPPPPPPPLISLQALGQLVTLRMHYANVLEWTERRGIDLPLNREIPLGGVKVLFVSRGDCLLGTDLRQARYENTSAAERTTTLVLPSPRPLSPRVVHGDKAQGGSYFANVDDLGLQVILRDEALKTKVMNKALALAQQDIERACAMPGLAADARRNVETLLRPTFDAVGWKVTLQWQP